jgi:hypothetical protein
MKYKRAIYKPLFPNSYEMISYVHNKKLLPGAQVRIVYKGPDGITLVKLPKEFHGFGHANQYNNSTTGNGPSFQTQNYWWMVTRELEIVKNE